MSRIHCQGSENRKDLFVEVGRKSLSFIGVEIGPPDDLDSDSGEFRQDRIEQHPGVSSGQFLSALPDQDQLFARGETVGGTNRESCFVAALESGDSDHVELVEVRGEYGEELGSLQEGE